MNLSERDLIRSVSEPTEQSINVDSIIHNYSMKQFALEILNQLDDDLLHTLNSNKNLDLEDLDQLSEKNSELIVKCAALELISQYNLMKQDYYLIQENQKNEYETQLQKLEAQVRQYISYQIENQLFTDELQAKLEENNAKLEKYEKSMQLQSIQMKDKEIKDLQDHIKSQNQKINDISNELKLTKAQLTPYSQPQQIKKTLSFRNLGQQTRKIKVKIQSKGDTSQVKFINMDTKTNSKQYYSEMLQDNIKRTQSFAQPGFTIQKIQSKFGENQKNINQYYVINENQMKKNNRSNSMVKASSLLQRETSQRQISFIKKYQPFIN